MKHDIPESSPAIIIPRLTLITDTSRLTREAFFHTVEQALSSGADTLLMREKTLTSAKFLALASQLRVITKRYQAQLIIHTQADIAAAVDADGVHLASREIGNIALVREWLMAPDKTLSVSCHHADELSAAHDMGADYAMLSPVFPTMTHPDATPLGVARFDELAAETRLPVIALGGITMDNCTALRGRRLAVIGGILDAEDAKQATQHLLAATKE